MWSNIGKCRTTDRLEPYTDPWLTSRGWSRTCREFLLRLKDGTIHTAFFKFR